MKINEYLLSHPCVDCAESDFRCLDFDHRDRATKASAVSRMIANQKSWSTIVPEIAKCAVRCSNCHRRRTAEQFNPLRHQLVLRLVNQRAPVETKASDPQRG